MDLLKKVIFFSFFSLLVFIAVWKQATIWTPVPVQGVFEDIPKPHFSISSFMNRGYQDQYEQYTEDLKGMKGVFTRIRNQIDFSLFGIPHATKIVRGKEGYLFGEENILAYLGRNFAGDHFFDVKIEELKKFQDYLWKEKNILLLVVFTPDKASFFPDLIPDRYLKASPGINNYIYSAERCKKEGINVIDFNRFFMEAKDTSRYPLFAKTGIHWSSYGALIAADSLAKYLSSSLKRKLPEIVIDRIQLSNNPEEDDDDISRTMNLFFNIPQPALAYPAFHYRQDSLTYKPSALFIGDSYYWNWQRKGLIHNLFRNAEFWYYDQEVYPETFFHPHFTWNVSLRDAVERQDAIIILQTNNRNDCDFGHGFVDRAWAEFDPSPSNRVRNIEEYLTRSQENLAFYRKKSEEQQVPLATVIRREAIFAGNNLLKNKR